MNLTISCHSCCTVLPEKALFCSKCSNQIKCLSCKEFLENDALFCIACGNPTRKSGRLDDPSSRASSVQISAINAQATNSIEFNETEQGRSFKATFTDTFGSSFSESINLVVGSKLGKPSSIPSALKNAFPTEDANSSLNKQLDDVSKTIDITESMEKKDTHHSPHEAEFQGIENIFEFKEEHIILLEPRLGGDSKIEQSKRLGVLLMVAYKAKGTDVTKAELTKQLKAHNAYDNHVSSWLNSGDHITEAGECLVLIKPGREYAQIILAEINSGKAKESHKLVRKPQRSQKLNQENLPISDELQTGLPKKTSSKSKVTVPTLLQALISEGYFSQRRNISSIAQYLSETKGHTYEVTRLSSPLLVFVRQAKLQRIKGENNQYEYSEV
jgi:hypothetical protein